jgi:dTDP-4-dehydrorhamnose reductase
MQRNVLLTGASGYVGARLYYDLRKLNFNVLGTYNSTQLSEEFEKLDITDKKKVKELVRNNRPQVIIHSAAYASSSGCDKNPEKAVEINSIGTSNIVEAANSQGSLVIFISATVAEINHSMYEKTKTAGENIVKNAEAGYVILRPSVVFGMSPNTVTEKPFNQMLRNTEGKGPFEYDTSWRFQPTWIGHISEIISTIIEDKRIKNEEVQVVVREMKSKFDIAKDVLSEFHIPVTPKDEKSWRQSTDYGTASLTNLELPAYNYEEITKKIVNEIKNRDDYKI